MLARSLVEHARDQRFETCCTQHAGDKYTTVVEMCADNTETLKLR